MEQEVQQEAQRPTKQRKPSLRATKALTNLVANGGNKAKAMRDAGFSPRTARNPEKVFGAVAVANAFDDLLEEFLPFDELLEVHKEGLHAMKIHSSMTEPDQILPDHPTRHKYLETGYKLHGKLHGDNIVQNAVQINFNGMRDKYK